MLKLQSYLTEQKNVHMEHLEDLVLNKGIVGAREIFAFLTSLGEMLGGNSTRSMKATVKWDGAPAIFMGIDPADKKFFIANFTLKAVQLISQMAHEFLGMRACTFNAHTK